VPQNVIFFAGFHDFWPPFAIMFSHILKQDSKRHVFTSFILDITNSTALYKFEDSAFPRYNQIKENNGQTC
jgi:hypothetical protein